MTAEDMQQNKKISRRRFLKIGLAAATAAVPLAVAADALSEPHRIELSKIEIHIEGLPPAFNGFRIAHITDLHYGEHSTLDFVRRAVEMANSVSPDLIALTGDYVTDGIKQIAPVFSVLAELKAKYGIVAVLGNHDHWASADETRNQILNIGAADLTNANRILKKDGGALCIAGVGDLWEDKQDLSAALQGIDPLTPRILLSHNPDFAEEIPAGYRIDLMIAGHTHGGQINLPFIGSPIVPSFYGQKYREGLVRGPHCMVYISRGVGLVGPPIRFRCRPEIPVYSLRSKQRT
jgi:uncharacterized protein